MILRAPPQGKRLITSFSSFFFLLFSSSFFSSFLLFCSELSIVNPGKVGRKVCVHSMGAVAWFWHRSGMLRHYTARSRVVPHCNFDLLTLNPEP
jgi:hypothetical protein